MTPQNVDAYNRALAERGVAGEAGPFTLLDLFPLTRGKWRGCALVLECRRAACADVIGSVSGRSRWLKPRTHPPL